MIVIGILLLFVGGVAAGRALPLQTMPDLDIPVVTVVTVYPGAGPTEVVEEVTKPIENATSSITGVQTQTATSADNVSAVVLEFEFGDDLDKAKREVEEAVQEVDLPEEAESPKVGRISFDALPIMRLAVGGDNDADVLPFVKDTLVPDLQSLDGVADVQLAAEPDDAVQVRLLPERLGEANITVDQVSQLLVAANIAVPAGEVVLGDEVLPVTVGRKLQSVDDLKAVPLFGAGASAHGGSSAGGSQRQQTRSQSARRNQAGAAPIRLEDVAEVERTSTGASVASRLNGGPAIGVNILKDPDANTVEVADLIDDTLASAERSAPDGVSIRVVDDQSDIVRESLSGLVREGLVGAALAMLMILLFLRNWRSTLIAAVSIPLSILIALIVLGQAGISLNIMTLAGLAVATGRIVDDSIVVIENIYRHRQKEDFSGDRLVAFGTKEVTAAITSSTFTVVGVFVPLALISGFIGQVFTPFAVAVVSSILASLLVALTVVPLLAKFLIAGRFGKSGREVMKLAVSYRSVLRWALDHKLIVLVLAFLVFGSSMGLSRLVGSNFLPTDLQENLQVSIAMPAGTAFDALDSKTKEVEELLEDERVESRLATVGSAVGQLDIFAGTGSASTAEIFVELENDVDVDGFTDELREEIKQVAGRAEVSVSPVTSLGGGATQQIEVIVAGDAIEEIRTAAGLVTEKMREISDLANVEDNVADVKDGVMIDVDDDKAVQRGLSSVQVGSFMRNLLVGKTVTRMSIAREPVDVKVSLNQDGFNDLAEIEDVRVPSPLGTQVRLGDVAEVNERPTPVNVTRRDGSQFASIVADVTSSDSGRISRELSAHIDELDLPSGVSVELSGVTERMQEGFGQLAMAMVIAVGVVYLIMVLTFGQARAPFAILFSLPFAATGALIGLYLGNQQINVSSMIGGLMLIGIVVTNAIVLIELVQQKRAAGMAVREALLDGGMTRFRPILMTAVTTIFALLPLGLGFSGGGLISQSLAVAVIGGLTTSTVLTLLITPVVFEFLASIGSRRGGRRQRPPREA